MTSSSLLVDRFAMAAEQAGCVVWRVAGPHELPAMLDAWVSPDRGPVPSDAPGLVSASGRTTVVLDEVPVTARPPEAVVVTADTPVEQITDAQLAVVAPLAAVAETGSLVLLETERFRRLVSLFGRTLVAVVPTSLVVPSLDDVAVMLDRLPPALPFHLTLVTGPSRTADIERRLTIGVQGATEVVVVLLDDGADDRAAPMPAGTATGAGPAIGADTVTTGGSP